MIYFHIKEELVNTEIKTILSKQGIIKEKYSQYLINENDERETILRAIKVRRGQQNFRLKLLEIYNNTCLITGFKIIDILEAAHIYIHTKEKKITFYLMVYY